MPTTEVVVGNVQFGSHVEVPARFRPDLLDGHAVQQRHDARALTQSMPLDGRGDLVGDGQHAAIPAIRGGVGPPRDRVIAFLQIVLGIHDGHRRPSAQQARQNAGDGQIGLDDVESLAPLKGQKALQRQWQQRHRRPRTAANQAAPVAVRAAQAMNGNSGAFELGHQEVLPGQQVADVIVELRPIEKGKRVHQQTLGAAKAEALDQNENFGLTCNEVPTVRRPWNGDAARAVRRR